MATHKEAFTRFKEYVGDYTHNGDEKSKHIQTVVLVPGKIMSLNLQMFGTIIAHDKLNPENRLIQRLHRSVMMDPGQMCRLLFIPVENETKVIMSAKTLRTHLEILRKQKSCRQ